MTPVIIFLATYLIFAIYGLFVYFVIYKSENKFKDTITVLFGSLFSFVLARFAGLFYGHLQPFVEKGITPIINHASNNAFPSDHVGIASVFATFLFLKNRKLGLIAYVLVLFISWGRVLAEVHYPIDVIAGVLIGAISSYISYRVIGLIRGYSQMWE